MPRLVETLLRLVDDVANAARLRRTKAIVAVAVTQRFQRITDFHTFITRRSSREGQAHRRIIQGGARVPQTKPMIKGGRHPTAKPALFPVQLGRQSHWGVGALRVEALHEGCRRPEIEPAVAGDVHSRRIDRVNLHAARRAQHRRVPRLRQPTGALVRRSSPSAMWCAPSPKMGRGSWTCTFAT